MLLVPEESEFLAQFGFTDPVTMTFGALQITGGLLLLVPATRLYGAVLCALCFAASFGMILTTGDLLFACVSLLPVLISGFIALRCWRTRVNASASERNVP